MSGHSKWATIKRQKAANDKSRGQVFSKLSRAITIAAKTGGGTNPDSNFKLRVAIDAAKSENMPKETIERAINKANGPDNVEEVTYEGFGPGGVGLIIQTATDNRNRTAQEIKGVLDRAGGSMGQPGAVSFSFDPKGYLLVGFKEPKDEQILSLIDLGADDVEEGHDGLEVYVAPGKLYEVKSEIEKSGYSVLQAELIQKPKVAITIEDEGSAKKLLSMLDALGEIEDVQRVFDNSKIPDELANKLL